MKKTIIALMALSGVAMGEIEFTRDIALSGAQFKSYQVPEGKTSEWQIINWKNINATNLTTDFKLLQITDPGNYVFTHLGSADSTEYPACAYSGEIPTITKRESGDVFFANVTSVSSLLGIYGVDKLTSLSLTTNITNGDGSDSWWGLYKMDSDGAITELSKLTNNATGSDNDLRNKTSSKITLTDTQITSIADTDKLIVAYRQGAADKTLTINSLSYKVGVIPEPTTATLSLLALAGLAARRRRR